MSGRSLRWYRLTGTLLLLALLVWIGLAAAERIQARLDPEAARQRPPITVEVAEIRTGHFAVERSWRGSIEAEQRAVIAARQTAQMVDLGYREGARVEPGDVLFRLDDTEPRLELDRLHAVGERLEGEAALARRERRRQEDLMARNLASEAALDEARQRAATLVAQIRENAAAVALAEQRLSYAQERAPFASIVQRVHREVGELARSGEPVVELVAVRDFRAVARVPQADVDLLRPNMPVRVEVPALSRTWPGRIDRVYPELDLSTRSAPVAVLLPPGAEGVRVGMAVRVHVQTDEHSHAITVPSDSLHGEGSGHWVFVFDDGAARKRPVVPGPRQAGRVLVREGLQAGEKVIVTADPRLADGLPVRVAGDAPADPR